MNKSDRKKNRTEMKNFKLMNIIIIMIMLSIEKKNFIFETEEQKTHRRLPDRDETMSGNV